MNPTWCSIHNSKFYRNEKGGKVWYSHRLADRSGFCNAPTQQTQQTTQDGSGGGMTSISQEPNWDEIAEGKVRNSVAVAFIQHTGIAPCTSEVKEIMESWVEYIMKGIK